MRKAVLLVSVWLIAQSAIAQTPFYKSASPVHQVSATGRNPPFIIAFSGGMPPHSPMSDKDFKLQANLLATALENAGAKAYLFPHESLNHTELNRNFGSGDDHAGVTAPILRLLQDL